jgi:hypothetical protein
MTRTYWGEFGLNLDRREPDGTWFGLYPVTWLGIVVMRIGRYALVATWPVRFD